MEIRTAAMADLQAISALEAECFPAAEAASRESIRARLAAYPEHFWLLLDGKKLVGFVNGMVTDEPDLRDEMYGNASLHKETGAWQMIFGVDTAPAYRRQGCAGRLLAHVIAEAKRQGRKGLILTCKDALVHYYAKFGFVSEGVSQSTHGNVRWYQMRLTF
ncbi:MAG TPA: GNAT family N-acetyltransferase [Clostridiales bacterium]|nr:GNAT family N-acetyltransferase [Clostridiales bacterium]